MKILLLTFFMSISSLALGPPLKYATLLDGRKVSELAIEKKYKVIFFLSTSCPCTKSHIPHLQELAKEYSDFIFIGIHSNSNETLEGVKKEYSHINFPIVHDKKLKIADQFQAIKTPHVFVLSPDEKILFHGGVTNSTDPKRAKKFYLKNALEDISKGQPIRNSFAKALGCYIVR